MFRLSSGHIPPDARVFPVPTNTGFGKIFIANNGDISLFEGSNGWVSLDGVYFYVVITCSISELMEAEKS
ncbi:hypothetical protein [Bacillus sp. FJAT-50079]|uniref:hypothetical protein n=1 Tax=Bacillus sp. FJAT-50079 TaxID=2833577 RepID=UPI001BC9B24C|nr:hypothetical protein [Bacillus sp. FJAT-50079]MBS4207507.1 hypothetical protein [Bacillus sp. FJAT-50079]